MFSTVCRLTRLYSAVSVNCSPAKKRHLHVSPEQDVSDGRQLDGTALHLQTLLLHGHLTQVLAAPRL